MIGIGDKIEPQWFVTLGAERFEAGAVLELRDAQGEVRWGQILSARPLPPDGQKALRADLEQLPPLPCFLRPEAMVVHPSGIALAVLPETPPPSVSTRLAGLDTSGVEGRRVETLRTLLGWFVPLVRALGTLHALQLTHGSIGLKHLHLLRVADSDVLALSGFGITSAGARAGVRAAARPRDDLGAIVLALHECFEATHSAPDRSSLPRWELLKRCVRGGDHAALESAAALVTALESLQSGPVVRKIPLPEQGLLPPGGAPPPPSSTTRKSFQAPPMTVPPPPLGVSRRARWIALGGLVAVLGAVAARQFLGDAGSTQGAQDGTGNTRITLSNTRCATEPTTLEVSGPVAALTAGCLQGDAPAVTAVGLVGESAVMVTRPATLGAAFSRSLSTVTDGVRSLGTVLATDEQDLWLAWRPVTGAAFGVVQMLPTQRRLTVATAGWEDAPLDGASLLFAAGAEAWVASTLRGPEGAPEGSPEGTGTAVVVAQLDGASGSPAPFTVFAVARGRLLAVIPGDPATLLVHTRGPDGTEVLQGHIVPLRTLSGITESPIAVETYLAPPAPTTADAGTAAVPPPSDTDAAVALSGRRVRPLSVHSAIRSAPWTSPRPHLRAAPLGIALGSDNRAFLLTASATPNGPGLVSALVLPPRGTPASWAVADNSAGIGLHPRPDGVSLLAVVREGARVSMLTSTPDGVTQRSQTLADSPANTTSVACGGGEFLVAAPNGQPPSLVVQRAPCGMTMPR